MTITRATFLGASVTSMNSSIRRGDGAAELQLQVCVDETNGDRIPDFATGVVKNGHPVYFNWGDFSFGGIIRDWKRVGSSEALYAYDVTISDAKEVLSGVQVIVSDYSGNITVPNLYNVYGYLENQQFGGSNVNEAGMPLFNVVNYLTLLVTLSPIRFRGDAASNGILSFGLDLSELPIFSANYRIAGPSITVLELIEQVCGDAGYDYFLEMHSINGLDTIKVKVIPRATQPISFDAINTYVTNVNGAMAKSNGKELRNETTSKFIVGGPRIDAYFQDYNGGIDSLANIWPFWGFNANGTAVLGTGTGNNHTITVDTRHLSVFGIGDTYTMDVAEMRAALADKSSWESLLQIRNGIPGSVQFKRADNIGLVGGLNRNILTLFSGGKTPSVAKIMSKTSKQLQIAQFNQFSSEITNSVSRLYEFVRKYATEFYGKKFMVNLPFSFTSGTSQDPDTGEYSLIKHPEASGWIDETSTNLPTLISNGYLPDDFNRYTTEDGRIKVMMRVSNYLNYDFSDFPPDSLVISGNNIFIIADVVIGQVVNVGDDIPRAVVTLPGTIGLNTTSNRSNLLGVLEELLNEAKKTNSNINQDYIDSIMSDASLGALSWGLSAAASIPDLAIIPLQNNQVTYGPWSAAGAAGKVDFEYATDLVPWNFGSESAMNLIGNARVASAVSSYMEEETGEVVIPDLPDRSIGQQLISGGPYITDIGISKAGSGFQTTYNMKTWTPRRTQAISKSQNATIQKISKTQQLARRRMRDYIRAGNNSSTYVPGLYQVPEEKHPSKKNNTTNAVLFGTKNKTAGSNNSNQSVGAGHFSVEDNIVDGKYQNVAAMSMDGKDVAFSTNAYYPDGQNSPAMFPFFGAVSESNAPTKIVPYRNELDPFRGDHDIQVLTTGSSVPRDGLTDTDSNVYRAIGHRGPLMVAGYGRDSYGFPVPNQYDESSRPVQSDVNDYADNHKLRRDLWKVGPLDLYFDEERGNWYSSPVILKGYLEEDLSEYKLGKDASGNPTYPYKGTEAKMKVFRKDPRVKAYKYSGELITVTNRDPGLSGASGAFVQVRKDGDEYIPFWVGC